MDITNNTAIWENILSGVFGGMLPTTIGVFLAWYLGKRENRSQRWWEKKTDEYIRVINELTNYKNSLYKSRDASFWSNTELDLIDKEMTEELRKEDIQTRESVRKIAMAGSILISDEAGEALTKFLDKTDNINLYTLHDVNLEETFTENKMITESNAQIKDYYTAIGKTIDQIRKYAKKDLGLSKTC